MAPESPNPENIHTPERSEERIPIQETDNSVSYLGVELPKAENAEGAFVPRRESYADYINDRFALELQRKLAISFLQGDPVLIEGGTSLGKTTTVKKMAAELGWEVHYANLNGATDVEDLMGRYIPNPERRTTDDPEYIFADGKVTSGLRQEDGKIKVIILDEINASSPSVLIRLHEVLDSLERDGDVVLAEDASEAVRVDRSKTKIVALMNPPGQGYLDKNPMDPAQLRRWVYQKEVSELPSETFDSSTDALFGVGDPTMASQIPESAYLESNEASITPEQLGEIPGIREVLEMYKEFHRAAKELLRQRKIAEDQPQPFAFDDRMEPRRVRDFVLRFYRGDINETFQTALRYYYSNKLENPADRRKLEELISNVSYAPRTESQRRGIDEESEKQTERISRKRGASREVLAGTVEEQIEIAIEKLGRENVLGPEQVDKAFGVRLREVPEIPFSVEELERAEKMGQMLVLRVDKTEDGKPMSMEAMSAIFTKKRKGGLLNTAEGWRDRVTGSEDFAKVVPRPGWALVSKDLLPNSTGKNYVEQTEILIKSLRESAFEDIEVPEEYEEAIREFESKKDRLTKLMSENWQKAAKELSELKISQLTRSSVQETIYDLALYHDTHSKRLFSDSYTWSNSLSRSGYLIHLGEFGSDGVSGRSWKPDGRLGDLGVSLSRRS